MAGREPPQAQANHFSGHSTYVPPAQHQQHNYLQHGAEILPAWGNGQLEGEWEGEPLAAGNGGAVQGTLQDPHHLNVENYDTVNYPPPPGDPAVQYVYLNGRFAQRPREHGQFNFPENDIFDYAPSVFEPGPNQAAFPDAPAHHGPPALDQPAGENLRPLASRYVRHPASRVYMIRMEPGFTAGRYRVVIALDIADFL